jgi:hypothetical protein
VSTRKIDRTKLSPAVNPPAAPQPPAPPPAPPPNPPSPTPDPNAALAAYVQQAIGALDQAEIGLGADPALSPAQKRHAAKLRKGGEQAAQQIGNLAKQRGLESQALQVDAMTEALGKAQTLLPLANRLVSFTKHVEDVVFVAESLAWEIAMQFYALLQRRALTDAELAKALDPVTKFFAYRHRSGKTTGPTKRQRRAASKAVRTLANVAPEKLAPGVVASHAAAGGSAPEPHPQPAPGPEPAPAASNGAGAPAARSS